MKLMLLLAVAVAVAACSTASRPARTSAKPPATRAEPVKDTLHGVDVVDHYRWLEGDNSDPDDQGKVTPEVAAWTDAQNALHARGARQPARPRRRSRTGCGR